MRIISLNPLTDILGSIKFVVNCWNLFFIILLLCYILLIE